MAEPTIKIKRSSVAGKTPSTSNLSLGELGLNTYDGKLFLKQDQGGVGVGTTVITVNPWNVGVGSTAYNTYFTAGNVGIGLTNPTSKLQVQGDVSVSGVVTAVGGFNIGIQSAGLNVVTGVITALNFVGTGNTFNYNSATKTIDISISGSGAGSGAATTAFSRTVTNFTATSGQTTFNLSYTVGYVDVYVNGVYIDSSEYTATNGTSVILNVGANAGDTVSIITYVTGGTLVSGVSDRTKTLVIAGAGQTEFTVDYISDSYLDVYLNGSKLNGNEYTATNGTTVGLTTGASLNDELEFIAYNPIYSDAVWSASNPGYGSTSAIYRLNSNVGIGTTNPTAPLHISGADAANAKIKLEDNNNGFAASEINVANGGRDLRIAAPQDIYFEDLDTNTKTLYIKDGGNVGIGTDDPVAKLNVVDNSSSDALRITQTGSGNALVVEDSINPDATPFVIRADGKVGVGTTGLIQYASGASDTSTFGILASTGNAGAFVLKGDNGSATDGSGQTLALIVGSTGGTGSGTIITHLSHNTSGIGTRRNAIRFTDNQIRFENNVSGSVDVTINSSGSGELLVGRTSSTGTSDQLLQVEGGAYVSGNVGIGTTNPLGTLQVGAAGTNVFVVTSTGSVGIGTTTPGTKLIVRDDDQNSNTYSSQVYRTSTNFSSGVGHRAYYESYYTTTQTSYASGINASVSASVAAGSTNNGYIRGGLDAVWRNNANAQSSTDNGTLAYLYGRGIQYGHYDDNEVSPITNTATGLYLTPYCQTGSIGTLIGLDINSVTTAVGATATNVRGINCEIATTDGTNPYNLYISGNAKNYIAGDVGIGTTNPTVKLEVLASDSSSFGISTAPNNATSSVYIANTLGDAVLALGNDDRVSAGLGTLANNGSVINLNGKWTSASPASNRTFGAIGAYKENNTSANQQGYLSLYTRPSAGSLVERVRIDSSGNVGIGTTNPLGTLQVGAAGTNVFVVTGIGSVGIGTTNPLSKLHYEVTHDNTATSFYSSYLQSGIFLRNRFGSNVTYGAKTGIVMDGNSGEVGYIYTHAISNSNVNVVLGARTSGTNERDIIKYNEDGQVQFLRGALGSETVSMHISDTGSVGIGTTNPGRTLHVNGGIRNINRNAASTQTALHINTTTGDIAETASSRRFKRNIEDYTKGIETLVQLRPVSFNFLEDDLPNTGLIAEEVHELGLPEFIRYDSDDTPYSIPYDNLTALYINSIKDLKAENDLLRSEIEAIKQHVGITSINT